MEEPSMSTATMSDIDLQRDVLNELKWDPAVNAAHIGVTVTNGIVTLTGYAESLAEKYAAERAAKRVLGVRAVANELEVKLPDSGKRTDVDIAASAVRALQWNILVPADKIKVMVDKGWVTLEGEVKWQFQKKAAEWTVSNIPGVLGVTNNILVKPRVAPTEVKSKIEEALTRAAELDANHIKIQVDGTKVILRGHIRSWVEREEAERTAWSAPGVTEVINEIVVAP
jgi:osmotically-inducible protein OsmY